jgi:hypothetical protein
MPVGKALLLPSLLAFSNIAVVKAVLTTAINSLPIIFFPMTISSWNLSI